MTKNLSNYKFEEVINIMMENAYFCIEKVDKREIKATEYEIPVPYISQKGSVDKDSKDESSFEGALRHTLVSDILCAANITKNVTEGGLYKVIGKPLQQNSFGEFSGVYRNEAGSINGHAKFENAGINSAKINANGAVAIEVVGGTVTLYTSSMVTGTINGKKSGTSVTPKSN